MGFDIIPILRSSKLVSPHKSDPHPASFFSGLFRRPLGPEYLCTGTFESFSVAWLLLGEQN